MMDNATITDIFNFVVILVVISGTVGVCGFSWIIYMIFSEFRKGSGKVGVKKDWEDLR